MISGKRKNVMISIISHAFYAKTRRLAADLSAHTVKCVKSASKSKSLPDSRLLTLI